MELYKKINNVKEHTLQKQFVSYLHLNNILTIGLDVMDGLKFVNSQKQICSFINHHMSMGYTKGQPDLAVLHKGKVYFIEMKAGKGKQSESQKEFQRIVEGQGHFYQVIRTWEECEKFVNSLKK